MTPKKEKLGDLQFEQEDKTMRAPQLDGVAPCGQLACNGCYSVGEGIYIHPPRNGRANERAVRKNK